MVTKTFYIFRHGQTDWNKNKRIQGHTNTPLNDQGRREAGTIIPKLQNHNIEVIVTSDLERAKETAEIVAKGLGVDVHVNPSLREANFGEAEGMYLSDVLSHFGEDLWEKFKQFDEENPDLRFPGGESRGESIIRMRSVIKDLIENTPFHTIGISTHGGVVRNLLHSFLPKGHDPIQIPNCVVYKVTYNGKDFLVEGPI